MEAATCRLAEAAHPPFSYRWFVKAKGNTHKRARPLEVFPLWNPFSLSPCVFTLRYRRRSGGVLAPLILLCRCAAAPAACSLTLCSVGSYRSHHPPDLRPCCFFYRNNIRSAARKSSSALRATGEPPAPAFHIVVIGADSYNHSQN